MATHETRERQGPVAPEIIDPVEVDPLPWMILAGWIGLVSITLIAAAARLVRLDEFPAGLADPELAHALIARQGSDFGVQWAIENAGALSIPLVTLITLLGRVTEFDIAAPRMAAGLFGAGSILLTGLWIRRGMGPLWGIAAAAVLAGSFWHLLFSRLALGQIAGTFAVAALCWTLTEASHRRGSAAMVWYVLAGISAGLAFTSAPALRLLPLVMLAGLIVAIVRLYRARITRPDALNWLAATAATYLSMLPFLVANRDAPSRWTPWTETSGLPNDQFSDLTAMPSAIIDTVVGLGLSRSDDPALNMPAEPWFSLLILPWAAIGVLGLISASNEEAMRDHFLVGLGIGATLLIGVSAVDAGNPGHLVLLGAPLAALPVYGFRTLTRWAQVRTVRVALAGLFIAGIGGEGALTYDRYVDQWAAAEQTRTAFNVDLIDALRAIESLDHDEPVLLSVTGRETVLGYFSSTRRRHTFDGARSLPFPARESGYLVVPGSEPLHPSFAVLLEEQAGLTPALEGDGFRGYRLDDRLREQMPFTAPTVPYPDGPVLNGHELTRSGVDHATVLIAWLSSPDAPAYDMELRLRPSDDSVAESSASTAIPANPLRSDLYQVLVVDIDIPENIAQADLGVRLIARDGNAIKVDGVDEDDVLFLNRYAFR